MPNLSATTRAARTRATRSLGFGASAPPAARSGLAIIARGPARGSADIHLLTDPTAIAAAVTAAADAPVGLDAAALDAATTQALEAAGAAFVLFQVEGSEAAALLSDSLEYALRVPAPIPDDGHLRALATLRPALIVLEAVADPLGVPALLAIRRLALVTGAALAAPVAANASAGLLQALRDSGVVALILEAPEPAAIDALRARLAALPKRKPRSTRGGRTPSLPLVGVGPEDDEDDD